MHVKPITRKKGPVEASTPELDLIMDSIRVLQMIDLLFDLDFGKNNK